MDPSLAPLASVARALGPLVTDVVFIGGAVAPLLQTSPPFPRVRPTKDVDAIVASAGYGDVERLHRRLEAQGFRPAMSGRHLHQWLAPDGTAFDLVPAGAHAGGSGNPWDAAAIETAMTHDIEPGLTIRHVSAPGFLALKWGAFRDRGQADPLNSHDLEDIIALIASRPQVVPELRAAPQSLAGFIAEWTRWLLAHEYRDDLLAANLNNATSVTATTAVVLERLFLMAA